MSHHCCYNGCHLVTAVTQVVCPVHLVNDGQQTLLHVGYTAANLTNLHISCTPSNEQENENDFIYFYTTCSLKTDQI